MAQIYVMTSDWNKSISKNTTGDDIERYQLRLWLTLQKEIMGQAHTL